jgi:surface antigen
MAQLTHGMNIDQVEELGRFLQGRASALEAIAKEIDGRVRGTSWIGTDANRFQNQWWPEHRNRMTTMAETVKGFGQSALNNASDQRRTSDAGGTVAGPGGKLTPKPATTPGGASAPGGGSNGAVGATTGRLPNSSRTDAEAEAAYRANTAPGYGPGTDYEYQCTAWANARWRELGFTGGHVGGNGGAMAANAHGTTSTPPSLGAMASYGGSKYGHVMIIEEVYPDGRFRVSEMNMGRNGAELATADEFQSTRIFTHNANGTWTDSNGTNVGAITIAGLPR